MPRPPCGSDWVSAMTRWAHRFEIPDESTLRSVLENLDCEAFAAAAGQTWLGDTWDVGDTLGRLSPLTRPSSRRNPEPLATCACTPEGMRIRRRMRRRAGHYHRA